MGVDFSNCDAHWSYGGFNLFRKKLCHFAGHGNLDDYKGFGGKKSFNAMNDDIKILLSQSDCDGFITPKDCKKLIPRLKELSVNFDNFWHNYDFIQLNEIIKGLQYSVDNNVNFEFI